MDQRGGAGGPEARLTLLAAHYLSLHSVSGITCYFPKMRLPPPYKEEPMSREFLNPASLCKTAGWTHVVKTNGGKTIHISGQTAIDAAGNVVGKGDLKRQAEQTFENLRLALEAAGATWHDVVVTRLYVVNLKPEHVPIIREIRSRYVSTEFPPASTLVGVSALVGTDWLIEIEATAVVEN
jgi:enamine deaminase RidA (YjgF/YER057c/UK114 family)